MLFRGAAEGREPGIHNPDAAEYDFRVRRFAASRNDEWELPSFSGPRGGERADQQQEPD
jgi:hypothetical protein